MSWRRKKDWRREINSVFIRAALVAYTMKGGYIVKLTPEIVAAVGKEKRGNVDWGLLAKPERRKKRGRPSFLRVIVQCEGLRCHKKPTEFKGKTKDDALEKAWQKGWRFKQVDNGDPFVYCKRCAA